MINVTDTIKDAYSKSTTQYDKIVLDDEEYPINNVELDDDCYEEGNIFGTAIAKALSFEIDNSVDLEGKEFKYFTGIKTTTGIEWIDLGTYITQEVEPNDTTKINTVNAMDYMLKTNIEYTSDLQYSNNNITLGQVAQEACNKAGIILATTDFPNVTFIVDSNQFEQGTLIRQVISAIAQITGTVAKIKNDDKLYFITPKTTGIVRKAFNLSDYSETEIKRATHPINLVSLGMSDVEGENVVMRDEQSILLDGENSLVINDNPFAYTEAKRQQLITAIFNAVKGFEYKAFELTGQGLPYLESLDNVQVVDFEGNTYNSFLFRYYYKSPNGLETEMSAPSIIKATVDYQNVASAEQIAKRTEIIVNKQEQTITGIVENQSEFENQLTQVEQTVGQIQQQVSSMEEFSREVAGTNEVHLENTVEGQEYVLNLKIKGDSDKFIYLTPSDTLVPSNTLVPLGDHFTLISDKQNRSSISNEAQIIDVMLSEPLRSLNDTYDELNIVNGKTTVIRRIGVDSNLNLYKLENEVVENLQDITLKTFDKDTYIYIKEYEVLEYTAKYIIENDYLDIFATQEGLQNAVVEMNSSITQTAEEINLEVSKKVGDDEIISKINQSAEQVTIDANRLNINGTISANGNFKVGTDGTLSAVNANLSGKFQSGNSPIGGNKRGVVIDNGRIDCTDINVYAQADKNKGLQIKQNGEGTWLYISNIGFTIYDNSELNSKVFQISYPLKTYPAIMMNGGKIEISEGEIHLQSGTLYVGTIHASSNGYFDASVYAPDFVNTSKKEKKENIKKIKEIEKSFLDIVKNTDICEFNFKGKKCKQFGVVIGKGYNAPDEILSENKEGSSLYSMISVLYAGFQEYIQKQEIKNKELEEKINELEEKLKNYEMDKENSQKANQNND